MHTKINQLRRPADPRQTEEPRPHYKRGGEEERKKNHCSTTQLAMYHCCDMHRGRLPAPGEGRLQACAALAARASNGYKWGKRVPRLQGEGMPTARAPQCQHQARQVRLAKGAHELHRVHSWRQPARETE